MKKVITIILDGFGCREEKHGNAIASANLPNFNYLWDNYPHSTLEASAEAVGLPAGQIGGSEVGHQTIGAGRVIKQELLELNEYFETKAFDTNSKYLEMIDYVKQNNVPLHLMGLVSDGGVHSHIDHLKELINLLKKADLPECYIHVISDGRDTSREVVMKYINKINKLIENTNNFKIATVCGRFYAMDRDNRWERTKIYYDLITRGSGYAALDLERAITSCYKKAITDEFLPPILLNQKGLIKDKDAVLWFNFRADRARQILSSLTSREFNNFLIKSMPNLKLYSFYDIDKSVNSNYLFATEEVKGALGKYLGELGLNQARIAETEKFAHITYFFDGLYKGSIENCDRFLVPSPKVSTYDKAPEMSAEEVCRKTLMAMNKDYDFILVNFANPDMLGHTGDFNATVKALEKVDECLGQIKEAAELNFYTMFIMADHGNAEEMLGANNEVISSHTLNKVPFIVTDEKVNLEDGALANVAPAILKYMDIRIPDEMKETNQILNFE